MDWEKFGNYGLPGLMLVAIVYIVKAWLASNERVELERVKVEDKKADAMASALTSLSGKIDTHHTVDLQSHQEMSNGIFELHGKIDQALSDRATPVEGVPRMQTGPYGMRPKPGSGR